MKENSEKSKKPRKVKLNVDLAADLTGFQSAKAVTEAHRKIMKNYCSSLLVGPPPSDDLLELIAHMYTEDEADVAQHLPPLRPRTAAKIASLTGRSEKDVGMVLRNLTGNKRIVAAFGEPVKYTILPILPGTFEMALMKPDMSGYNSWHEKFSEKFLRVWDSGFIRDYVKIRPAPVRYIPAVEVSSTLYMAWPSDRLEDILDRYDTFSIGNCQCRVSEQLVGEGCGKPIFNCTWFGPLADIVLDRGLMRRCSKEEVIEAKKEAEANGCITWMMNEYGDPRGNASCSCCGCCCKGLKTITQFSAPGFISRPHFMPKRDREKCNNCGACIKACPMAAWSEVGPQIYFNNVRCVGCGLCVISCKTGALSLEPVVDAKRPEKTLLGLFRKTTPDYLANAFRNWLRRAINI